MDLTAALLRAVAARPRLLLATTPGGAAVRLAAERQLRLRDWPSASTPAEADLLLVAGPACAALDPALARLWRDMPAPRARLHARTADEVTAAFETGRTQLASAARQRVVTGGAADPRHEHGGRDTGRESHDDHAGPSGEGEAGHHNNGRGRSTDHTGNGAHGGHGGPGAGRPAGLPMAGPGPDRDGLSLDRLHVSLGPFLADWPGPLTIRLVLQGDVIQRADLGEPVVPGTPVDPFWVEPWLRAAAGDRVAVGEAARRRAAAHLDSMGRLLGVAGWPAEAVTARRLRDDLLDGAAGAVIRPRLERFARRVGRSRTLSWLSRGIGVVTVAEALAAGVSGPAARADGDVAARYRQWLTDAVRDVERLDDTAPLTRAAEESPRGRLAAGRPPSAALVDLLPRLLVGAELAAARLIVASFDPDPDELAALPGDTGTGG